MKIDEVYNKWKHLGDCAKDFGRINKDLPTGEFDIRLAMLSDCWEAIEEYKLQRQGLKEK